MDLHFVSTGGRAPISMMDVGYFVTIQEIKEMIEDSHNIPAHRQTLIFNNQILLDELKIYQIESITDNSHIQLIVDGDHEAMPPSEEPTTIEVNQEAPLQSPSEKIALILRHSSLIDGWKIESDANDSIQELKENIINEVHKGLPVEKLIVRSNGVELHDHNILHECGLFDNSEIEIYFKRPPPSNNNTPRIRKIPKHLKELKIMVLTISCGTEMIVLEMNELDNVGELRQELERKYRWELLNLSEEGFFFKYNQAVMEEDKSFQWHNVQQGDTIEIINGKTAMIESLNL